MRYPANSEGARKASIAGLKAAADACLFLVTQFEAGTKEYDLGMKMYPLICELLKIRDDLLGEDLPF